MAINPNRIPSHAKNGEPTTYAIVNTDGSATSVLSKTEFLKAVEDESLLYIDPDNTQVVLLPPTADHALAVDENRKFISREAKYQQRWHARTQIYLDAHIPTDEDVAFELADDFDFAAILEDTALLVTLFTALGDLLKPADRQLAHAWLVEGKTEREIAPLLGLKEPKSVNYRKHRIIRILLADPRVKSFFEEI